MGGNISQIIEGSAAQNNWYPIQMGNGTWKAGGNVAFSLYGGSADTSVLELTRATGTQSLRVVQGSLNRVVHGAAGVVKLDTALSADSLDLTDGSLDLNGWDVRLAGSLRADGPPALLANLGGRTLIVAGDAAFLGREDAPLLLNPAAAWTVNATGTLTADFADLGRSLAAGSTGTAGPECRDLGGNVNWSFAGGPPNQAPAITRQPADASVSEGRPALFSVSASGHIPRTYSWRRTGDTTVIGTDSVLTLPAVSLAQDGSLYRCVVANSTGSATSREARLTVIPKPTPPAIVREPSDTSVKVGARVSFSAGVSGSAPLSYAWRRDGDTALLSQDSLFVIATAAASLDGAAYYVIVSNSEGSDTSSAARLLVRACDSLVLRVSRDTAAKEGEAVVLWGQASCAERVEWSVVSGPAPRLIDPGVDTLAFKAPRVAGDTAIRYLFTAYSGAESRTLPWPCASWNPCRIRISPWPPRPPGTEPPRWCCGRRCATRPASMLLVGYPLRYLWWLDPPGAEAAAAGDSLVLRNPAADGILQAILCLDNGGAALCDTTRVDVRRASVSAAAGGRLLVRGLELSGGRLRWLSPGEVRIWDWRGRLLFRAEGVPGTLRELPESIRGVLRGHRARLLFTARPGGQGSPKSP